MSLKPTNCYLKNGKIYIARSNIQLSKNESLTSEFNSHIFKVSCKVVFQNVLHGTISCKMDTEATFHLDDKVPYKNHTRFRCSLNLCDSTEWCLLENYIKHEKVQDCLMVYKILKNKLHLS